jgi:hypothetical protein
VAGVGDSEEGVGERAAGDGSVDEWSRSMVVEGRGVVIVGDVGVIARGIALLDRVCPPECELQ